MALLRATLDAIHGEDDRIAGGALTLSTAVLSATGATLAVESTIGFGEVSDGAGDALLSVDAEIIYATGRTDTSFTGLSRAQQNTTAVAHGAPSVVVDIAGNSSALDLVRRGLFSTTATGADLDVVGRNLGLHKCPGITEAQWRKEIQTVAYLAKQPMSAIETALEAFYAPSAFEVYERLVSTPYTIFARIDVPGARDLRGRFFLNSGEPHVVAGGAVVTAYPIVASTHVGTAATGSIRVVSGHFLVETEQFVVSDGSNPAVHFEFDDDGDLVQSPTLRAVNFVAGDGEAAVRAAAIAAINAAPALNVTASPDPSNLNTIFLVNDGVGAAGNVAITETVAEASFVVAGMSGGRNAGTLGVFRVVPDNARTRQGDRDVVPDYFTTGTFVGSTITLGSPPADGTHVLVDYNAFAAHYLPPNSAFQNQGDFPPYFADNLQAARCILDLVRAAGVGIDVAVRSFT